MTRTALATVERAPDGRPSYSRKVIQDSLTLMRTHLGMEVAFVGRFAEGRRWFEYVDADDSFCPIAPGRSDPLELTYCALVADGRIPELIPDTAEFDLLNSIDATAALPVGSHMSVPMRGRTGKPFGTLCCFSRHADSDLRERDLSIVRMFADLIGTHMQFLIRHEQGTRSVRSRVDRVLRKGGPRIALQPILDIVTCETYGFEALSRFPSYADWTPDRWFREAATIGQGPQLEASAVRAALTLLPTIAEGVSLSVNVSAQALFEHPDLATLFTGEHAARLVVELTEHARIENYGRLETLLQPMRDAGARIAVDDAGSGYAGLEHILQLRPEVLKLDRALVDGIAEHPGRRAMCQAMASFTAETGSMLIAEGVENAADLTALRDLGVGYAQGYHLGMPRLPD